jgi:hypothetical protein
MSAIATAARVSTFSPYVIRNTCLAGAVAHTLSLNGSHGFGLVRSSGVLTTASGLEDFAQIQRPN